jgi:hypothetical protein
MYSIIFLVLGLACFGWAAWRWRVYRTKLLDFHQTEGKVVAWRYGKLTRKTPLGEETIEGQFPCVEFTPHSGPFKETVRTIQIDMSSANIGDTFVVWYDADHPQNAQVASRFGMSIPIYASAAAGIALIFLATLSLLHRL